MRLLLQVLHWGILRIIINTSSPAIVIEVDNVNETFNTLQNKGVTFLTEPQDMAAWEIKVIHFKDPENNLIELFSELPKEKWEEHLIEDEKNFKKSK